MIESIRLFLSFGLTICVLSVFVVLVVPGGTAGQQIGWLSLATGLLMVGLSLGAIWISTRIEGRQREEEDWQYRGLPKPD